MLLLGAVTGCSGSSHGSAPTTTQRAKVLPTNAQLLGMRKRLCADNHKVTATPGTWDAHLEPLLGARHAVTVFYGTGLGVGPSSCSIETSATQHAKFFVVVGVDPSKAGLDYQAQTRGTGCHKPNTTVAGLRYILTCATKSSTKTPAGLESSVGRIDVFAANGWSVMVWVQSSANNVAAPLPPSPAKVAAAVVAAVQV